MAAQLLSLGKVTVPTPGTPVVIPIPASLRLPSVHSVLIQAVSTNTGKIYIGVLGLTKATLVGVLDVLAVPTANTLPTFTLSLAEGANAIDLTQLRIDADTANEGVLVSALIA